MLTMPIIGLDRPDPLDGIVPNPDTDYRELSDQHFETALAHVKTMRALAQEVIVLMQREIDGKNYVRRVLDLPDTTLTVKAVNLLEEVKSDIKQTQTELVIEERAAWESVKSHYVAERMYRKAMPMPPRRATIDGEAFGGEKCSSGLHAHARATGDSSDSPVSYWHALVGTRKPPGTWPPSNGEEHIEGRAWMYPVGYWTRDELMSLLFEGEH